MAENTPENMSLLERLYAAYTIGWDESEEVLRKEMIDLLERSGAERAELEARVAQLQGVLGVCVKSMEHIEKEMLPEGERFDEWSHPALSMRLARKVLSESRLEHHEEEGDVNS